MTEKKPVYEYRKRPPTEAEIELTSKMLAEGKSYRAMGVALGCSGERAKRICDMIEVQKNALRLRETVMIPNALSDIHNGITKLVDEALANSARLDKLESVCQKMSKALGYSKIRNRTQRETITALKVQRKALLDGYRKRGITPPDTK